MLARALPDNSLRYIQVRDDNSREILRGGPKTNKLFAQSLGILPDNTVKLFIAIEGPNDIAFLRGISAALRSEGIDVPNLESMELNGEIIFFPMIGSNLAHWASRLEPLNHREFHLCDRDTAPPDPPKYQAHVATVSARQGCRARSTAKKEIENYLHKDAIIAAYAQNGTNLPLVTNFGPFDDVPREVARLVHDMSDSSVAWNQLPDDKKKEKEKHAKHTLCSLATRQMNSAMLGEIDPDGDLLQWFNDIRDLLGQRLNP
jgi:hypothetical protein